MPSGAFSLADDSVIPNPFTKQLRGFYLLGKLYDALVAAVMTEPTLENIWLIMFAAGGNAAPVATATKPAIKAYSIRS